MPLGINKSQQEVWGKSTIILCCRIYVNVVKIGRKQYLSEMTFLFDTEQKNPPITKKGQF